MKYRSYKEKIKRKARRLRKKGYSFGEISSQMGIPKGTVANWTRDIILTNEQKDRLKKKSQSILEKGHHKMKELAKQRRKLYYKEGQKIAKENWSDLMIIGTTLYQSEGTTSSDHRIEFSNSDPKLIEIFLRFLLDVLKIDKNSIKIHLHLHSYHEIEKMISYWSIILNIPKNQFTKPYIKKHGSRGIGRSYNGVCKLRIDSTKELYILKGMTKYIIENI